jgi:soluble lytic murein transglycosylase-like protein
MRGTARTYGLRDPFDPHRSIDAQPRLVRDLLRQFASVPLALAAYNAGPAPVARCGCVPPFAEVTPVGSRRRFAVLLRGGGGRRCLCFSSYPVA